MHLELGLRFGWHRIERLPVRDQFAVFGLGPVSGVWDVQMQSLWMLNEWWMLMAQKTIHVLCLQDQVRRVG